jgi:hypothetical protein
MYFSELLHTVRVTVGILCTIVGVALMRGYRLHGLLSGGDERVGIWIGTAITFLGFCLCFDLVFGLIKERLTRKR